MGRRRIEMFQFYEDAFPEENQRFENVVYVDAVAEREQDSVWRMRRRMLASPFEAGVFIGGMEGILDEHGLFKKLPPSAKVIALRAPGGGALKLAHCMRQKNDGIDSARMFHRKLSIGIDEPRDQVGSARKREP